ncbi:MAG: glycosyltransferase, partial [Patescibacteria group bacterium]|nr:glycosyltransferase [Patescibacteria group bacterium]
MNILIVNYYTFREGGASVSSYYLANALKKLDNNVYIASTGLYPDIETFVFKKIRLMPIFQFRDLYLTNFLSKIIREKEINIIHSSDGRFTPVAVINVAKKYNIPSVVHFRDYWFCCLKGDLLFKNKQICQGLNLEKCLECRRKLQWPWEIYKYLYFKNRINKLNQADAKIAINGIIKNQLMRFKIIRDVEVVNNSVNIQ